MKFSIMLAPILFLSACGAPPVKYADMKTVTGDRQQGTMSMAATYRPAEEQLSWLQAQAKASARCRAWGFKSALPFDDQAKTCLERGSGGQCKVVRVTRTYQCSVDRLNLKRRGI